MSDEKIFWFNRHPCSEGLDEEGIREIADQMKIVEVEADEWVHRLGAQNKSIYLIVRGSLAIFLHDFHGREIEETVLSKGNQFGILGAAQREATPVSVIAQEPSTLLELDFQVALKMAAKYPVFQVNLFRLAGNQVRHVILKERIHFRPNMVLIVNPSPENRLLAPRLFRRMVEIGEKPCVLSDNPDWEDIPGVEHRSLVEGDRIIGQDAIRRQMTEWVGRGRIFIDLHAGVGFDNLCAAFAAADLVLWALSPDGCQSAESTLRRLGEKVTHWLDKVNLVWLLDPEHPSAPSDARLRGLVDYDFKVSFSEPSPKMGNLLGLGIERIVHQLRGVRIGLALGGGAARGMAHLGVLKALEQNGIVIDMIAGTSAGALTGTVYSKGLDIDYSIQSFANDLTPSWLFQKIPRGNHWYLLYKYRRGHFDPMLREYLADSRLEQHPLPMNAVAVDLVSGTPVDRAEGDSVEAILESMNLPVLSAPIYRNGQALVDGGLVNNIPADVLVGKGCNFVIAVSVTSRLEQVFGTYGLGGGAGKEKLPSTLQTIMRSYQVQHFNMNSVGVKPADFVISPDVTQFDLTEFSRTAELAEEGERATTASMVEIKTLLSGLDDGLFPRP